MRHRRWNPAITQGSRKRVSTMVKRRMRERAAAAVRTTGKAFAKGARGGALSAAEARSGPTRGGIAKETTGTLSRGKAKRAARRERAEKKREFIERELQRLCRASGSEKDGDSASAKAPGLSLSGLGDALREAARLAAADEDKPPVAKRLSARARKKLVVEETAQAKSVREHPAFKSNPVEALRQHLLNTVCKAPEKVPPALGPGKPGGKKERAETEKKVETAVKTEKKGEKKAEKKAERKAAVKLEASRQGLQKIREEAKENVRMKKARKAEMEAAAGVLQKKRGKGIEKKAFSPKSRGRIGVKRPKILD